MIALVFDTETNGLIENHLVRKDQQPSIIEFCGLLVDLENDKILQTTTHLIRPPKPLSDKPNSGDKHTITQITGITNELLADCPPFAAVSDSIIAAFESAPLIIAHNLAFDTEMVNLEMERLNKAIAWPRGLCSVEQTIHLAGRRLSLTDLHLMLFGFRFEEAHRAEKDTQALAKCCVELYRREVL